MEERRDIIPARSMADLLNETIAIYGKQLWRFLGLAAVVQVPVSLLQLIPVGGKATFFLVGAPSLVAMVCLFGATVFGVGEYYLTGRVTIVRCYSRVWWRMVSLLVISAVIGAPSALGLVVLGLRIPEAVHLVYFVGMVTFLVYSSMAVPGVVVEGYKTVGALKRSFALVRGSALRVFGNFVVYLLVATGLMILLLLPLHPDLRGSGPGRGQRGRSGGLVLRRHACGGGRSARRLYRRRTAVL